MGRRFQFSLGRLLLVIALFCAVFELGNLSLASWGPCGATGPPLELHSLIVGCAISYVTLVFCAIALSPLARPRTTAAVLRVAMIVLAISVVATFAFFAKLVHDTHGIRTIIFTTPMKSD